MLFLTLLILFLFFPIVEQNNAQNRWSKKNSHSELFIMPNNITVICKGKQKAERHALGELMTVPHVGIVYFEIKLKVKQRNENYISIGLLASLNNESYSYYSNGTILGHNFYGSTGFPTFGQGDTIGCGVNLTSMNAIYTINGNPLATDLLYVTETDLFPRVSLNTPGDVIEANFGPDFMYKIGQDASNSPLRSINKRVIAPANFSEIASIDQNIRKAVQIYNKSELITAATFNYGRTIIKILVDPQQFFNVTK